MSDRTFRLSMIVADENGKVLSEESVRFDPHSTDKHGYNETAHMALEKVMAASKYDADQQDIEAKQNSPENRADHFHKMRKMELVD